jgi:RluA family pseudouridine synthase
MTSRREERGSIAHDLDRAEALMTLRMSDGFTELTFHYMRIDEHPETLLEFLLRRFRYLDEGEWRENIREGRLIVDGKVARPDWCLRNHQTVLYRRPDFMEPPVDPFFEVVYEDEFLIALNKSGDLPTSPSGKYFKNTLIHQVKQRFDWGKLYTLHRLDRETSGLILFAKQHLVAQKMAELFRTQQVRKTYLAILNRPLPQPEVFVSMPIGPARSEVRIKQGVVPEGKPSRTWFVERKAVGPYTQAEVRPLTGRTHQIRVHASYIGCPIVGDKLYGLPEAGFIAWLNGGNDALKPYDFPEHRQLLHAWEVTFEHPMTGKSLHLRADESILMRELQGPPVSPRGLDHDSSEAPHD